MSAETDLIASFVERWGKIANGIGDDAAVLDVQSGENIVVSTDSSVENVHFRRGDVSAAEIGYRAAAAALSDLAAMAAKPVGLIFALVLPESWRSDANAIADGVGAAAKDSDCPVIGGNISRGAELSLTNTVIGAAARPLPRDGARPGDGIFVTGSLGGAAAAVAAWATGKTPAPETRELFVHPKPRIREAMWLAENGATSAIDLSDGLAADAEHISRSSGVSLLIDTDRVPISRGATFGDALSGGEDYELLVTAKDPDEKAFEREFGVPLTRIGSVQQGKGVAFTKAGKTFTPSPGFDHLSRK